MKISIELIEDQNNGNFNSLSGSNSESAIFDKVLDKAWNLIRTHPFREVQTIALLILLQHKFPIYHRLAADIRLCRLVDPYLEYLFSNNVFSTQKKLIDMQTKERFNILKNAKTPTLAKIRLFRQKCDQLLATDCLRFYADCTHYEKCIVESGPARQKFVALRNRLRKCTKCATKYKV